MQYIIEAIQPQASKRFVKKKTILLYQGEIPRHALILRKGFIKVYSINSSGEEQIVVLHTPGDMLPLPWIFGESSSTHFYYEAVTDCEFLYLPKDVLLTLMNSDQKIMKIVLEHFVNQYTGLLLRVIALEQSRAIEKILFTLYFLMFRYGKEVKPGIFLINLKLTQPMIAGLVGLTRETTAKNLSQLRRKGIISYGQYKYTVDKAKLERYLGEDSFKDLVPS